MNREPQYSHNNLIDPKTGFIENPAYPYAFDAEKKLRFLDVYKNQGLDIYSTCDIVGVERRTVIKHYHQDQVFKNLFDECEREYSSRLEGVSRRNALNDKSVVERLAQLNSFSRKGLTSGKYTDEKSNGSTVVNLNFDVKLIDSAQGRTQAIDAEVLSPDQKSIDTQTVRVLSLDGSNGTICDA